MIHSPSSIYRRRRTTRAFLVAINGAAGFRAVWQQRTKWSDAVSARRLRCPRDNPLVDLLPEPAAIRNIWENKLALVESERIGAVVATER